jgi:hypothetical protein
VSQLVFILVSQIMSEKSPLGQALLLKGSTRVVRLPCALDGGVGDLLGER